MSLFGDRGRVLSHDEARLIRRVFKTTALPPLSQIRIRDGTSPTGTAITIPLDGLYNIMVGQDFFVDLSRPERFSRPRTLVHEMTHVWQYFHGTLSRHHGIKAHSWRWVVGKLGYPDEDYLYEYDILTDSWNDMGFGGPGATRRGMVQRRRKRRGRRQAILLHQQGALPGKGRGTFEKHHRSL